MVKHTDILIVGGGLNGAALAAALRHGPHRVTVLEPHPPALPPEDWDCRVYAYSPGNIDWLRSLGAWNETIVRAQPVWQMRIHGDAEGRLRFDALDAGLPELAWIAENRRLQWALWHTWHEASNVEVIATPATGIVWGNSRHEVLLADGTRLGADLLVAADGANSWVRQQAQIDFTLEDYRHVGVVANFVCEKPHRGIAWQWFRDDGVLAYLPLPGQRISIVWSTPPEHAQTLLGLPAETLAKNVAAAGLHSLGALTCITPAAGFPLKRRLAHEWVRPGLVLLGDTAHTVHPLAGQGVNLGFRDSRLLAAMLAQGGHPGEISRLQAYAARRREDVMTMQTTSGAMKKLFARTDPLTRSLRNTGMSLTHGLDPINQALMRHATL